MTSILQEVVTNTNVLYLGDVRTTLYQQTKAPLLPRHSGKDDSETATETAIRLGLLLVVAGTVLFAAYQL